MMYNQQIVNTIANKVKEKFLEDSSGHDWTHIQRVWDTSKRIGAEEKADLYIVELAALLHDIADYKLGTEETGIVLARSLMDDLGIDGITISQVEYIIKNIGFKGGNKPKMETLEGQVVQDADRLDAIGAIGIARCFAFAGARGNLIYDPPTHPDLSKNEEQYKRANATAINHFYEKLLLLKDKMNTKTGRQIAENRHAFMQLYLDKFFGEMRGES